VISAKSARINAVANTMRPAIVKRLSACDVEVFMTSARSWCHDLDSAFTNRHSRPSPAGSAATMPLRPAVA
jgi:hypothetical protein